MSTGLAPARCPLCASAEHKVVYDLRGVSGPLHVPGVVVRCTACSMWYKILPEGRQLSDAYGDAYAEADVVEEYMGGGRTRAFFRKVLEGLRLEVGVPGPRLLDIGTGFGAMLEEAQAMGLRAEGIDLCERWVEAARARGLDVQRKRAEDLDADGAFDVVTMMDLVEHVPDPLQLMAAARRALRPGGQLVVYTPNHRGAVVVTAKLLHSLGVDFAVRDIFGSNHVCFFDDRTLPTALGKAGFSVTRMRLFPYDPWRPGGPVSPVELAAITLIEWMGRPFRRMVRMLAYARRL